MAKLATGCVVATAMLCIGLTPSPAMAQFGPTSKFAALGLTRGATVKIGFHGFASGTCAPARSPTIRVIASPRAGMLTIKPGELTTDKISSCSDYKTPVQVVFYQAGESDADTDHLTYEVTNPNGEVEIYQFTIHIRSD